MHMQVWRGRLTTRFGWWAMVWASSTGVTLPALAHHALGGELPTTGIEGFLSGLAHPVIGFDHLATIVGVGWLGVTQGVILPVSFILGTLAGTGCHAMGVDLPGVELGIAAFLVVAGVLLVQNQRFPWWVVALGAIFAGGLHGYAYGEAIVGAGMMPLMAYLCGFSLIQLGIALGVWGATRFLLLGRWGWPSAELRAPGWVLVGVGLAFLVPHIVELIVPVEQAGDVHRRLLRGGIG